MGRRLIRYDGRGTGLSERHPATLVLDAHVSDLTAVVDAAALESFSLLGLAFHAPVAIAYAAQHPERIERLALYGAYVTVKDVYPGVVVEGLAHLARTNWDSALQMLVNANAEGQRAEELEANQNVIRLSVTGDAAARFLIDGYDSIDVGAQLPLLTMPALVTHRIEDTSFPFAGAERIAGSVPGARLVALHGTNHQVHLGNWQAILDAIDSFVPRTTAEGARREAPALASHELGIVLFTDIADSTALTERLGDVVFREASRMLDDRVRAVIRADGGTPIEGKVLGDGVMGVFSSAAQAIAAARACVSAAEDARLQLHSGLHAGDVIHEKDNVYGGEVNIASRICGISAPGEILVSQTVRDLARTSAGVTFRDRGEHELKGIADPVHVFAVVAG